MQHCIYALKNFHFLPFFLSFLPFFHYLLFVLFELLEIYLNEFFSRHLQFSLAIVWVLDNIYWLFFSLYFIKMFGNMSLTLVKRSEWKSENILYFAWSKRTFSAFSIKMEIKTSIKIVNHQKWKIKSNKWTTRMQTITDKLLYLN